jgi:hypothetical protein
VTAAKALAHPRRGVAPSRADKATSDLLFYIPKMKGLDVRGLNWFDSEFGQSSFISTSKSIWPPRLALGWRYGPGANASGHF